MQGISEFKLFALKELTEDDILSETGGEPIEVAIRLESPKFENLTLESVQNTLKDKSTSEQLLQASNEAVLSLAAELKRLKKVLMSAVLGPDESALTSGKKEPSKDDMVGGIAAGVSK